MENVIRWSKDVGNHDLRQNSAWKLDHLEEVCGGLRLPQRPPKHEDDPAAAAYDALSRDLAALMAYGREDSSDEI